MITLPEIWDNIQIFLGFKKKNINQEYGLNFAIDYNDKRGINYGFVASRKVANYATTDSQLNITSETATARAELLNTCGQKVWENINTITSRSVGIGKVMLFPYVSNGKIMYNVVNQDRVLMLDYDGENAVDAVVLADTKTINNTIYGKYKRYTLQDGVHTISEFYANLTSGTVIGAEPPRGTNWEKLEPFSISNVERLLFAEFDCPIDPRVDSVFYRVGITDGCQTIIEDLRKQLEYMANEYGLKKVFIGVSSLMFKTNKDGRQELPTEQVYKVLDTDKEDFFQVFSPEIRSTPIFERLKFTYEMLENHMVLSRGIFTSLENNGSYNNTSSIKRSVFDTYAFVGEVRAKIVKGINQYLYACNVLAEYFGLSPQGVNFNEIDVAVNWSNALIEDSNEEYNQYKDGVNLGYIDLAELRQWVTGEDMTTATARVEEIAQARAEKEAQAITNAINANMQIGG